MPPAPTTRSAQIGAPQERVFDFLADPDRWHTWFPACTGARAAGPLRRGVPVQVDLAYGRTMDLEITEFAAPNAIGWVERQGRPGALVSLQLMFGGGSTTLVMKDAWTPATLKDRLVAVLRNRRDSTRFFDTVVNNLRRAVTR